MKKSFSKRAMRSDKPKSNPSKKRFPATEEQQTALAMAIKEGVMKIQAPAGSGKSTTLFYIGEHITDKSIYLAYNKTMALEAKDKCESLGLDNITCMTTHSLAYQVFGRQLHSKLSRPRGRYVNVAGTPTEISKYYKLPTYPASGGKTITKAFIGLIVRDTCNRFEMSKEYTLDEKCIPRIHLDDVKKKGIANISGFINMVVLKATSLWKDRQDTSSQVLATHNTYLKMYQLSKPDLSRFKVIYMDEVQDANPVTYDIVMQQEGKCKIVLVGDMYQSIYCQPKGTLVKHVVDKVIKDTPIECLKEGDKVLSYSIQKSHMHRAGKPITKLGSKFYKGKMVSVKCGDSFSEYTEDHLVPVRASNNNDGKFILYLMERQGKFRVGVAPWRYNGSVGVLGINARCASEKADRGWILEVFDCKRAALNQEALLSYTKMLPQTCFIEHGKGDVGLDFDQFWAEFPDNYEQALEVLSDYGRKYHFPMVNRLKSETYYPDGVRVNDNYHYALKNRSIFVTAACNLLSGMTLAEGFSDSATKNIPLSYWKPIQVSFEEVECEVYSMDVADNHTYVADNILTHNCFNGARNYLKSMKCPQTWLSKSFRFGSKVADIAKCILGYKIDLIGNEKINSIVGTHEDKVIDKSKPYTILYRTNMSLILDALDLLISDESINITIDVKDFIKLLQSCQALHDRDMRNVKHDSIIPYENWGEIVEEAKNISEVKRVVSFVEGGETDHIISTLTKYRPKGGEKITLVTAHKSKGMEYSQVLLSEDFPSNYNDKGEWVGVSEEERNLLYVAATRGINVLQYNTPVKEHIEHQNMTANITDRTATVIKPDTPPYCPEMDDPAMDTEDEETSFETVTERQKLCIDSFLSKEVRDMMKSIDLP